MNINDYLIEQSNKDWAKFLSGWAGAIPKSFTLWLVNRFGDAFLVPDDGSVYMLDVGVGSYRRVADSRDHFADLLDIGDNSNNWLLIPLVNACAERFPPLLESQCYGFNIPPLLGGKYVVENVEPTDLSVHYSRLADIYDQTKELPEGASIKVVTVE